MEKLRILIFTNLLLTKFVIVDGQLCTDGTIVGENDPKNEDKTVDTSAGLTVFGLANDRQYTVKCCGFIKSWSFFAKNSGTINLQVWRPGTSPAYSLVGENVFTVAASEVSTTVSKSVGNSADWIPVDNEDILAWYTPGVPIVSYDNGNQIRLQTGVGTTSPYDWGTAPQVTNRDYGIHAIVTRGSDPVIDNLATKFTMYYNDDVPTSTLVTTLVVSDNDPADTLTTVMTTSTAYFTFSTTNLELRTAQALSIGTHTMNFRVTDRCGQTDTGTIEVIVSNNIPVIHNMVTASATVNEGEYVERELFAINVTDASEHDFVVCDVKSSTPAAGTNVFFTKLISGTSQFGIFLKDQPGLDYDTTNKYDLIIECTDYKDPVTAPFTVYVQRNQQPVFTNLQNSVTVSTKDVSIGTIIFNTTVTDSENDQIFYSMDCVPTGGPFTIYNSGAVVSTIDLAATTVTGYDCNVYINDSNTKVGPRILTVTISDINHPPIIENLPLTSAVSVVENIALGASVYQVSISDQNSLDTHAYTASFDPGLYANYIVIDSNTGLISTSPTNTIDYESFTDKTVNITVTVSDGQDTDTELLQVTITNVNEAPTFVQNSYSISGNEGPAGTVIGIPTFDVKDPDGDTLRYSIDCAEFSIDKTTGQISLASEYDTDAANVATSTTVQCNVNVSDGALQDTATLQVTLNNINDNTPVLSKTSYSYFVNANDDIGTVLTGDPLAVTDGDAGVYGQTSFSLDLTGLSKQYFAVSSSGEIYISTSLLNDFSTGTLLTFTAITTDSGGLTDTAGVTVLVSSYTTTTPTTTTDRYLTFFESSANIAWFTILMMLLAAIIGLSLFWFIKTINWSKILAACKRRPKRKWAKWEPRVERKPGSRLPPPPSPPQRYIAPPPKIKPSGVRWEYWKDADFETGNLG